MQKCWWAYNVFIHRLLCKSHTRIVLSSLADIIYLPPGWKAMPRTQLSWPVKVIKHTPTLTSHICVGIDGNVIRNAQADKQSGSNRIHTRIVLSLEPDAKNGPWCAPFLLSTPAASLIDADAESGAQAIHSTVWSWSRNSTLIERIYQIFVNARTMLMTTVLQIMRSP